MAVEGPVARRVGGQVERHLRPRRHIDRVLQRLMAVVSVDQLEEVAVQVDGVGHHGVVDQGDADPLVQLEADRLDQFRELAPVKAPHEPFHIAGQMDFHRPRRGAGVRIRRQRAQIGVDQHPVIHVLKALRTIAQTVGGRGRDGVHPDADRHVGGGVVRVAHAHAAVVHRRGGGSGGGACCAMR
ncbi:hypothetical protein D3C75_1027370 [compost metagenome]